MTSQNDSLKFGYRKIGQWTVPTLELSGSERQSLSLPIMGYIANSIHTSQTGKERLNDWKVLVASEIKAVRSKSAWNPESQYAISIGFSFNARNHGNRRRRDGQCHLDVENFKKPVIDAIAAGLFCGEQTNLARIPRWDYDDSNFDTLLIHRLPDVINPKDEGIAVFISSHRRV